MTKKHFIEVAATIRAMPDRAVRRVAAKELAATFKRINPRFDHHRFYKACGL